MDAERNPYRPGVGLTPPHLAGRDDELGRFRRVLRSAPEIPGNIRISGLRGVGKTVLLGRFKEIAEEMNWATISLEVEPRMNAEGPLLTELTSQFGALERRLSRIARVKAKASAVASGARRIVTVSYEGFEWSLAGDLSRQTAELGQAILESVKVSQGKDRHGLVLLLDEAQILTDDKASDGTHALSTLVAAVSTLQKEHVPVCLVLCGLPTLAVNLLNARTYSERMFQGVEVRSLDRAAARDALTKPLADSQITAEGDLVDRVMDEVEGYPYFIQLWGAELWDATMDADLTEMTTGTLDVIEGRIYERLDSDFYEPRIASLTPAEQDLLLATARCSYPPLNVSELNNESPKSPGNINVLLGRLVGANVLFRERKGAYRYTAPGFRDFLQRRTLDEDY
jgi:hypothetical protein